MPSRPSACAGAERRTHNSSTAPATLGCANAPCGPAPHRSQPNGPRPRFASPYYGKYADPRSNAKSQQGCPLLS
eukprot:450606-Pleurochrysis_carterae.AAC.1